MVAAEPTVNVAGETPDIVGTDDPAGAMTVSTSVPLTPSLVAVMVTLPALAPVTRPFASTVATRELLVAHTMLRPVSVVPGWSFKVTVTDSVVPAVNEFDDAESVTVATWGCVTVMVVEPAFPSTVAPTIADPTAIPFTTPLASTVTALVFDEDQVAVRPDSTVPLAFRASKLNVCVAPTPIDALDGLTITVETALVVGGVVPPDSPPPQAASAPITKRPKVYLMDRISWEE
jgi:hypothetical protein